MTCSNVVDVRKVAPRHEIKRWGKRGTDEINGLVIHHAAGRASWEDVAKYHIGPDNHINAGGCPGICYHFYIEEDGRVYWCNHLEDVVWANRGGNKTNLAACVSGDFTQGRPTLAQIKSVIELWESLRESFNFGSDDLHGHYHYGKPTCPGPTLREIIESIRAEESVKPKPLLSLALDTYEGRQMALRRVGYYTAKIDGLWGPQSRRALAQFQRDNSLTVDALWGPQTERAMIEALNNVPD